ncbi:ABC transporter permease [Pseudonocardia asaccharolytica]|uniref:Nickel ABC transporter permease subunit NikC n=1 Tax=Pseudonocardia asaccharolytica DSM 44247 = NBRC 16224 TaxID=1123024 RepID=A0A511CYB3_9PSEU|nr:ABC transporter permease [Pseudonocardia asaccharolytica]GEL17552.1 nickel ABC transporter permease subunit NikC [Pseudonocardia asaccharolytica DSM 44247 = NBRC 16224]
MSALGILRRPTVPAPPMARPAWAAVLRRPAAQVGLALAAVLALAALLGPLLAADPDLPDYTNQLAAPSWAHWLGTDQAGRDLLARTLAGARTSLGAALLVMAIAGVVGLLVGTLAGAVGGIVDTVLTRATDVLLGLPSLVLTLAVVGVLGPGFWNLVLAMAATSWAGLARLARSLARGSAQRPDVLAARMSGVGPVRAVLGHVVPGVASQVVVAATLGLGEAVLALGGLSFLGLGAQPPTAEWGTMLATGRETFAHAPWQLLGPGLGLVLSVAAATLISDALRDVTDPGRQS